MANISGKPIALLCASFTKITSLKIKKALKEEVAPTSGTISLSPASKRFVSRYRKFILHIPPPARINYNGITATFNDIIESRIVNSFVALLSNALENHENYPSQVA